MRFQENFICEGFDPNTVDEENFVIKGVRIINPHSENGREYLKEAIQDLHGLITDNAMSYIDHDKTGAERSIRDWSGWVSSPRIVEGRSIAGDYQYLKSEPQNAKIIESIKRGNRRVGFSIDAEGEVSNGQVTKVTKLYSVDLVTRPATTSGSSTVSRS